MLRKIRWLDFKVTDRITGIHCRFLDKVMIFATYCGIAALFWWITLAIPFMISREYRERGIMLIIALGFNYLLGEIIIKKAVGRDRPSNLISEEEMKIQKPKDNSFPSGHAASSFCAFSVTLLTCPAYFWIPALVFASIISFSRIYLRVHYLSDIIGGIVLGMFNGTVVVLIFSNLVFVNG